MGIHRLLAISPLLGYISLACHLSIRKHGLDFVDAPEIFSRPMLTVLDDRFEYGEDRWIGIGVIQNRIVVVVYTEPDDNTIRIISLRKALRHERTRYEQALQDQLGAG
jgi:uncharacterized DUF497 family protein